MRKLSGLLAGICLTAPLLDGCGDTRSSQDGHEGLGGATGGTSGSGGQTTGATDTGGSGAAGADGGTGAIGGSGGLASAGDGPQAGAAGNEEPPPGDPNSAPNLNGLAISGNPIGVRDGSFVVLTSEYYIQIPGLNLPEFPIVDADGNVRFASNDPDMITTIDPYRGDVTLQYPVCAAMPFFRRARLASSKSGDSFYAQNFDPQGASNVPAGLHDFQIGKISPTGDALWTRTFGAGPDLSAAFVEILPHEQDLYVFAKTYGPIGSNGGPVVVKYDSSGEIVWSTAVPMSSVSDTYLSEAILDSGEIFAEISNLWRKMSDSGEFMWSATDPLKFDSASASSDSVYVGSSTKRSVFRYRARTNNFLWGRSVQASTTGFSSRPAEQLASVEWAGNVQKVAVHAQANYLLVSGTTQNRYRGGGNILTPLFLDTDFVARIEFDGSLAWYRQFAFDADPASALTGQVVPYEDDTRSFSHFDIRSVESAPDGNVVVAGTRASGVVAFTLDADDGALLQYAGRSAGTTVPAPANLSVACP